GQIEPEIRRRLRNFVADAEVDEIVVEMRAEEEFGGEIAHDLVAPSLEALDRLRRPFHQAVPNGERDRDVPVVGRRVAGRPPLRVTEVIEDGLLDRYDAVGGPHDQFATSRVYRSARSLCRGSLLSAGGACRTCRPAAS